MAFKKLEDPLITEEVLKDLEKYVKDGHVTVTDEGDVEFASGNGSDDETDDYVMFKNTYRDASLDGEDLE